MHLGDFAVRKTLQYNEQQRGSLLIHQHCERAFDIAPAGLRSGKVRDLYRLNDGRVVLVASDRISAFDVVLPTLIPDKGRVLTAISRFWFAETASMIPNHLLDTDPAVLANTLTMETRAAGASPPEMGSLDPIRGRIMICRPASVVPAATSSTP